MDSELKDTKDNYADVKEILLDNVKRGEYFDHSHHGKPADIVTSDGGHRRTEELEDVSDKISGEGGGNDAKGSDEEQMPDVVPGGEIVPSTKHIWVKIGQSSCTHAFQGKLFGNAADFVDGKARVLCASLLELGQ